MIEEMQQDTDCQRCGGKGCIACDARVLSKCQHCEYHKNRAARWRAEAYKLVGHEIELPWVGLTDEERHEIREWQKIQEELGPVWSPMMLYLYLAIEAKLKEKNT